MECELSDSTSSTMSNVDTPTPTSSDTGDSDWSESSATDYGPEEFPSLIRAPKIPSILNDGATAGHGHAFIAGAPESSLYFILDSGCSHHMSLPVECFTALTQTTCRVVVSTGNGKITATGKGQLEVLWTDSEREEEHHILLQNVLRIPHLPANLLSVSQLCDKKLIIEFENDDAMLSMPSPDDRHFAAGRERGLYTLPFKAVNMPDTAVNLLASSAFRDNIYRVHNALTTCLFAK